MTLEEESDRLAAYAKWGLAFFVIFVIACFKSCTEIRYVVSGVKTSAHVDSVNEYTSRTRRSSTSMVEVHYSFKSRDQEMISGGASVAASAWSDPRDDNVNVTYIPSEPAVSILTSQRTKVWLVVWLVMIGVIGFFVFKFWREVEADTAKDRKYWKAS